jgi:hypothetical protein
MHKILPMGSRPKDAATARALEELAILLRDIGRNQRSGVLVRDESESRIAVGAAVPSSVAHVEIDLKISIELTQLLFEVIAREQGVTPAEDLALSQVPVAREQPSILTERSLDQRIVGDDLVISRVVAKDTQPARKATEHRVGDEPLGLLIDLRRRTHG